MDARRRNGLLASCDPCRKRKIGCDHRKPICKRCERRGQTARCIYQPTPTTETGPRASLSSTGRSTSRGLLREAGVKAQSNPSPVLQPASPAPTDAEQRVRQVKDVLRHLRHFDRIHQLLRDYYASNQGPIVPGVIVFAILEAARNSTSLWQAISSSESDDTLLLSAAQQTISITKCAIEITPKTTVAAFCASLCSESIRLEALGIVCSVAARACKFATRRNDFSQDDFINDLYGCSLECRRLSREIATMNDALLWLTYENVILTTYMHGDSSEYVWQRLDHLGGDVSALGVHRESFNTSNTPLFLSELRRRAFHKAYGLDVYLSGVFDRPSRISKRHADCALPLDLDDNEICVDNASTLEIGRLSSDGWSLSGQTNCATWIRTRSLFSSVKEEIAECSILSSNLETQSRLWCVTDLFQSSSGHLLTRITVHFPRAWMRCGRGFLSISATLPLSAPQTPQRSSCALLRD